MSFVTLLAPPVRLSPGGKNSFGISVGRIEDEVVSGGGGGGLKSKAAEGTHLHALLIKKDPFFLRDCTIRKKYCKKSLIVLAFGRRAKICPGDVTFGSTKMLQSSKIKVERFIVTKHVRRGWIAWCQRKKWSEGERERERRIFREGASLK